MPTYAQHRRFCEIDSWEDKDAKSKKSQGDHHRYVKTLPNGEPLFTEVSHGSGQYRSPNFWAHIRRDQLKVTEDEFWDAVDRGIPPKRAWAQPQKPEGEPIPMPLVINLRYIVGLSIHEIGAMTPGDAEQKWQEWLDVSEES